MTTTLLKKKLHRYIDTADERKLQGIYMIVQEEIESPYDKWEDNNFLKEMNSRVTDLSNGKAKSFTAIESIDLAKKVLKKKVSKR